MKYINDIHYIIGTALPLAGLAVLFLRPKFRSRQWLLSFLALSVLGWISSTVPFMLVNHEAISPERFEKYLKLTGPISMIVGFSASVCLLVFIIQFTSILQYTGDAGTNTGPSKLEPKATASNPALGFALLILAPVLYVILGFVSGAGGLPDAIGNPSPISIAVTLACLAASIAAFAGKLRLR